jgi:hypothetical protein
LEEPGQGGELLVDVATEPGVDQQVTLRVLDQGRPNVEVALVENDPPR